MVRKAAIGVAALAAVAVLGGGWVALAQQPASGGGVVLMTGDAPFQVTILGVVTAEIHQKSLLPKDSNQKLADDELKRKAAAMGADAVVKVVYEPYNAALSTKGFVAHGVAVKYVRAPGATVAAAAPQPAPAAAPAPAPRALAQAAPPPAPVYTTPVYAAPAPVAAAPMVPAGPRPAALIALSESEAIGQAYTRIGEVKAEAHQKSLFSKKPARTLLDDQLRAEAARLGADAVVMVKYDMNSPMFSKEGSRATGIAVKFTGAAAMAPAAAPAPVYTAAAAAPGAPIPAPVAAAPVRTGPTPAALIVLREDDLVGQPYYRVGDIKAEAHQKAIMTKKPARVMLDESLRTQAARLGADAVLMIKYEMTSPMFSKEGSHASGVAVRFGSPPAPAPVATSYAAPASAGRPALAAPAGADPGTPAAAPLPTMPGTVQLTEADAGRPYVVLGQVTAEAHQAGARPVLEQQLREQAARLGADAVVQIRFDLTNGSAARGSHATGMAVKFR